MFKIISYILAYAFGSSSKGIDVKGLALEVLEEAVFRSRKTIVLLLAALCSTLFICGGIFIALVNVANQYDSIGHVYATATLWSGLGLSLLFIGVNYYIFAIAWPGANIHHRAHASTHTRTQTEPRPSELEQAISLLVMDFIDSRKQRREERQSTRAKKEARWESQHPQEHQRPSGPPH